MKMNHLGTYIWVRTSETIQPQRHGIDLRGVLKRSTPSLCMPHVFGGPREFVVIGKQRQQTRRARQPNLVGESSPVLFMWMGAM